MKVFGFATVCLAISFATASQIRGGAGEKSYTPDARKLAKDAKEYHRELGHGKDKDFNPYDNGAGCSCSKDAVKYIAHAHVEAMEKVPYVTLALLEKNKDEIWDHDHPNDYEPLRNYGVVTELVESLVNYARCILLQIDCNLCGVDGPKESRGRALMGEITPYLDISNSECCCDVKAIETIVVDHVNDFYRKALLNPGGDKFIFASLRSLYTTSGQAIDMIATTYLEQYNPYPCELPAFPEITTPKP